MNRILAVTIGALLLGSVVQAQDKTIKNANVASEAELTAAGLKADVAKAVIAKRPFASVVALDQFLQQQGMTREQITPVYSTVFVPVNLNTAADDEILLIPGAGRRMLREFKEYRPYDAIERFRKEIGKYVDAAEVARLESYVTLK